MRPLELERCTIEGVPVFYWRQEVGLPVAGLTFRVGRVDETAPIGGITHLVEHLALPGRTGGAVDYNGTVDPLVTGFYGAGDPVDVRAFIASTTDLLASLPLERLEIERRILRAEEATRSWGGARMALKLRFGPVGVGLTGYSDYGLLGLEEHTVLAWAAAHFTRGNVALWLAGMEPGDIELRLPEGTRKCPASRAGDPRRSDDAGALCRRVGHRILPLVRRRPFDDHLHRARRARGRAPRPTEV